MKKQILIVDDELDLRELLIYHLEDQYTEFHVANNCAEALALAGRISPNLVLLDILLPDIDGLTLCEALKQQFATQNVPIAMMSAHDSQATRQLARAAGAAEFFSKPFNLALFKSRVKQLLLNPRPHAAEPEPVPL